MLVFFTNFIKPSQGISALSQSLLKKKSYLNFHEIGQKTLLLPRFLLAKKTAPLFSTLQHPEPPRGPCRPPRLRIALVADAWALFGRLCLLARYFIAFILPTPNACRRRLARPVRARAHGRRRSPGPRAPAPHGLGLNGWPDSTGCPFKPSPYTGSG